MTCRQQHTMSIVGPRKHEGERTVWRDSLSPCRWVAARLKLDEDRQVFTVSEPEGLHVMKVALQTTDADELDEYMKRVHSTILTYDGWQKSRGPLMSDSYGDDPKFRDRPHLRGECMDDRLNEGDYENAD